MTGNKIKKRILYRSNYRGTKELNMIISSFVHQNIDSLNQNELRELDDLLSQDDEIIALMIFKKNKDDNQNHDIYHKISSYLDTYYQKTL